jgi:hypothetical protein
MLAPIQERILTGSHFHSDAGEPPVELTTAYAFLAFTHVAIAMVYATMAMHY